MLYEQLFDHCLSANIGAHGLSPSEFEKAVSSVESHMARLRIAYERKELALLRVPEESGDLKECTQVAAALMQDAHDILICGTGGSSLGAQALAQLKGYFSPGLDVRGVNPRLHFLDNLDAFSMEAFFSKLDWERTRVLIISKSGGTAETMMQALAAVAACEQAGLKSKLSRYFAVITEPGDNPLRRFAARLSCAVLDHNPGIGGRYSVLTNVGLLPATLLGLDAAAVRRGALSVLQPLLAGVSASHYAPAIGAALSTVLADKGARITVFMPYADALERFAMWYRQLWAESLGKDGKGTTPIRALGPVDQHSQLQLYMAGPNDKMFTLLSVSQKGRGPRLMPGCAQGDADLTYLEGHTVGDLVDAQSRATAQTLGAHGRPVRLFRLQRLDEEVMGALFMHFMLETIFTAGILNVDPFDQPAVEEGKAQALRYLSETGK